MGIVIGSPGKSPSHANTLINLTLVDPRFLTGALICAHLQPHGLYHAVGAWSPSSLCKRTSSRASCPPSPPPASHRCSTPSPPHVRAAGRCCRARVYCHAFTRSTALLQHVDDPYLLGLPHPEIWRHGASVSAQPSTRAIHLYF